MFSVFLCCISYEGNYTNHTWSTWGWSAPGLLKLLLSVLTGCLGNELPEASDLRKTKENGKSKQTNKKINSLISATVTKKLLGELTLCWKAERLYSHLSKGAFLWRKESENWFSHRSFGSWCVKGTKEPTSRVDSSVSVPFTQNDPWDLELIYLAKKLIIRFRILSDLRIQSWIFLKKRTLKKNIPRMFSG